MGNSRCDEMAILTATYNHPIELKRLSDSLTKQTDQVFRWIIIDDGSKTETGITVKKEIIPVCSFEVSYFRQENSGKAKAINCGLDMLGEETFVLIVDDDEVMLPNAVETVKKYVKKYKDKGCVMIDFHHYDLETKKRLANSIQKKDYFMSIQKRRARGIRSDGYTGYYCKPIKDIRFPVFQGEKYVGPSVLAMLAQRKGNILWANTVIGGTSYLAGGISDSGRKLRVKNPCGMLVYCQLMQEKDAGFFVRFLYSVMGWAYIFVARDSGINVLESEGSCFVAFTRMLGKILGWGWKKRYVHGCD